MVNIFKKHKSKILIDNYNEKCHLLNLYYNYYLGVHIGYCSLCGRKNDIINSRCRFCRAKIEK